MNCISNTISREASRERSGEVKVGVPVRRNVKACGSPWRVAISRSAVGGRACALRRRRHVDRGTGIPVRTVVVARSATTTRCRSVSYLCISEPHSHISISLSSGLTQLQQWRWVTQYADSTLARSLIVGDATILLPPATTKITITFGYKCLNLLNKYVFVVRSSVLLDLKLNIRVNVP